MKKILACLLAVLMGLGCLAGCTEKEPEEEKSYINEAKSYIRTMYKDASEKTATDYTRVSQVTISGNTFPITWTVEITEGEGEITVSEPADNKVTISVPVEPSVQINYTLTATVTEGENTLSTSFNYYVPAVEKDTTKITVVSAPAVGSSYKFGLTQANLEQTLFFTGETSGNYLALSQDITKAVDVTVEEVEGGYRLSFVKNGEKQYIDIYEYKEGKAGVRLTAEPTAVFTWNEDACVYIANVAGDDRYLGTYSTYNTISASATSYILGDNLAKIGVSQFPAQLVNVETAFVKATPAAGSTYKYGLYQANLEQYLYFTGETSGNYLALSADVTKAVDVTVEEVEGGFRLSFVKNGEKLYIDIYEYKEGKAGVRLTAEPTAVFTYNEDAGVYIANVAGDDRYLGTYNTYNTISASATSYILGDNLAKIDVSQFPAYLVTPVLPTVEVTEPKTETAYKFGFYQANLDQNLFFNGGLSGKYLGTTADAFAAADVYLEEVEGGYHIYTLAEDGSKLYLDIYEYTEGKAGVQLTTAPVATFVLNADANVLVAQQIAGDDRYMGTYNTYNTISASATSYILGDNLTKIGVSQFPAKLLIIGF